MQEKRPGDWILHAGKRHQNGDFVFDFECEVKPPRSGIAPDFRGRFIHGQPGERFVYLSWKPRGWKLAPHAPTSHYHHNRTGEDNADAHLKRQIMGREVVVAITNGKLDFGPWEQIFYGEFDGNRRKRALVKIIGE